MNWTYYKEEDGCLVRIDYERDIRESMYVPHNIWRRDRFWDNEIIEQLCVKITEEEAFAEML